VEEAGITTATSPQICCHITLRNVSSQLCSFTLIYISENNMLHVKQHLFHEMSFYLFFFLILTSLWHYCNILFVALLYPLKFRLWR